MKRHPFDPISFIFGAGLLTLGVVVVAGEASQLLTAWLLPAVMIGLGLLLLMVGWRSSRTSGDPRGDEA